MAGGTQSPVSGEHQGPPPNRGSMIVCRMRFSRKPHMVILQLHFITSIVPLSQPRDLITNLSGLYLPSRLLPNFLPGPLASRPGPLQSTLQTTTTAYLPKNRPTKCGILDGTLEQRKSTGDVPGGAVGANLPANSGDTSSIPGLERSHMLRSN